MNFTIAPDYRPHAKQYAFHQSGKRFLVAAAGVRGGKTYSATVEFLRRIYKDLAAGKGKPPAGVGRRRQPRLLYWVIAPTTSLSIHVHRYISQCLPNELIERQYEDAIWLKPDILIEFKTAERPERLVGASVNGMLVDEACRVKGDTWRGSLRGRLADTVGWAIFVSSPLGGRNNWVYQELVAKADQDDTIGAFHWTTVDNTQVPGLLAEAELAQRTMAAAWYRREFLASWDSFGGSVYEEFNDDIHVVSESAFRLAWRLPNRVHDQDLRGLCTRIVAGVDFGFTSAGAIIVVGQLRDSAHVVLEESYAPSRPVTGSAATTWVSEAKRLMTRWGVSMFSCDPSRPDAINDMLVNSIPAVGANNDIHLGIRRVAESLHVDPLTKRPGMFILSDCKNVVREMRDYQWKATKDQSGFAETPADGQSDHGLDGMRYAMIEHRPYASPKHNSNTNSYGRPPG